MSFNLNTLIFMKKKARFKRFCLPVLLLQLERHKLLLNPMITGERPLTAIITAHLIKTDLLICVHLLPACPLGFKESVLDTGKISAFIVQKHGVS